MRHKWDYSRFGKETRDMLIHGRRVCLICGEEHKRHQQQSWQRAIGYYWDGDGRTSCPGKQKPKKMKNES